MASYVLREGSTAERCFGKEAANALSQTPIHHTHHNTSYAHSYHADPLFSISQGFSGKIGVPSLGSGSPASISLEASLKDIP